MIELPNKKLFRPDELAEIFGVSKQTVYLWIETGELEAVRIGKKTIRIKRSEAMKMVKPVLQ